MSATDTEKAALERRIDELCAEVERLKGKLSESLDGSYALEVENLRLSDENFKLQQHLEAEKRRNAKLLEAAEKWMAKAAHFEAENAKLRDEVERLHADQAHWELGNCPSCPNVVSLQEALEENAKFIVKLNAEHIARQNVEVENAKLRDENAELQKLGGFMLRCMSRYHDCADCLVNGEHCEISHIEADALELGIEMPS